MSKKVFAFDMGKASIGYCVREDHNILDTNSIIIDKDYAEISTLQDRRRVKKTLDSHKAREDYFNKIWTDCGLEVLSKNDKRFTKEFPSKDEETIYTSCLLRIALLQEQQLKQWQIYKALHNAFQRRGYDVNVAWKAANTKDDEENQKLTERYSCEDNKELIRKDEYKYPCYYDAVRLGLWSENEPSILRKSIPFENNNKVRTNQYVAPRILVEKELKQLWLNAQLQLPQLNKYDVEEFLYGEYREAYGSLKNKKFRQYMGTPNDWQGVLGQKIPRFDNRIISKCKLLPKRNVCKADTIENVSFVLLMKLKNLRFTDMSGEKVRLNPSEIKLIYENWLNKVEEKDNRLDVTITKKEIEKVTGRKIQDKIEPMKVNLSGRSSFCRRACQIMNAFILSGELYPQNMDITPYIDRENAVNGITEEEIKEMLSKVGDWNNLYIPDNREEAFGDIDNLRTRTDLLIGNITNPIVRNRLQIFRDLLLELLNRHGKPDNVIFEFVRDSADNSLLGQKKASDTEKYMKSQEKENEQIKKELEDADMCNSRYFLMHKLLKMQCGACIYSGQKISPSNYDECEIDHIYPRSIGGNDALYNKVVCYRSANQEKLDRTPYEWLSHNEQAWADYVGRLNKIKGFLGKTKFELLTSKPEDCEKLIDSRNAIAETAHIARIAQQITAVIMGWGLQVKDEKRHIFVNNGSSTFAIRKRYGLNSLLGDDEKKNRNNDKHHALDAICISYAREFKYDKVSKKDVIEGFNPEVVKKAIDKITPYPYANKKPFKGNIRPLETIYGLRMYCGKSYITNRVDITSIEQKNKKIKNIVDEVIKNDLLNKLEENMSSGEWKKMLENYKHPKKQTLVKKVMTIVSEGVIEKDTNDRKRIGEFADFGNKSTRHQFKHSKGHKGQILYYNDKGVVKVMPVYANKKTSEVREQLQNMGCKLYNKGELFYSGCLINVPKEFNAGQKTCPAGIYKVRTIMSVGQIKLENNTGTELLSNAQNLVNSGFSKYKG